MKRTISTLILAASALFLANCACPSGSSCSSCTAGSHAHGKCNSAHCSACSKGKCCGKCGASAAACKSCN